MSWFAGASCGKGYHTITIGQKGHQSIIVMVKTFLLKRVFFAIHQSWDILSLTTMGLIYMR